MIATAVAGVQMVLCVTLGAILGWVGHAVTRQRLTGDPVDDIDTARRHRHAIRSACTRTEERTR